MNIQEFYRNAAQLKQAFDAGQVALEDLSDEGKTALAVARRQISVNDLSDEGRTALGLEPLAPGPGVGERLLHGAGDVIEATGLGEFGRRVGEQYAGATQTAREAPGEILQSLIEALRETGRGRLGGAAAEIGGAGARAAELGMVPFTPLLAPGAAAGGMATEQLGRMVGVQPEQPIARVGAAEFTPRGVGELAGSLLVPGMEMAARMPRPPRGPFGPVRGEPLPEGFTKPPTPNEIVAGRMAGEPYAAPPEGQGPLRRVGEVDPLYEELVAGAQRRAYTGPEARPTPEELARPTDPRVARRLETIDVEVELRRREAKRAATPEERLAISGRLRVLRKERVESVKMLRPDIPAPGRAPKGPKPAAPVIPTPTSPYEQFFGEYQEQVPPAPEVGQRTAYGPTPGFAQVGEFVPPVEELVGLEPTRRLAEAERAGGEFYPGVRELREGELAQALDTTSPRAQAVAREVAQPVVVSTDAAVLEHSQIAVDNDLASAAADRVVAGVEKAPVAAISPTAPEWFQRAWTGEAREVPFVEPQPMPTEPAGGSAAAQPPQAPPPSTAPVRMHQQTLERLTKMGFSEAEAQRVWAAAASVPKGRRLLMGMAKEGVTADVMRERWLSQGRASLPELYEGAEGGGKKSVERMLIADIKAAGHGVTVGESLTAAGEGGKRVARAAAKGAEITDSMLEALAESKGYKIEWVTTAEGQRTVRSPELVGPAGRMRIHDRAEMARFLSVEGPGAAPVGYEGVVPPGYWADDLVKLMEEAKVRPVSKFHPLLKRLRNMGVDVSHLAGYGVVTPKAMMATDAATHLLNQRTVELYTHTIRTVGRLRDRARAISDKYGLRGNAAESDNLFAAIDILNRGNVDEISQLRQRLRPELFDAIQEHRRIMETAAGFVESIRPGFRRVSGTYITHWPTDQALADVQAKAQRYADLAKQFPTHPVYGAEAQRLGGLVSEIQRVNTEAKLKRMKWLPEQKYFGPIDESRTWNLPYETKDYLGVVERYLDGIEKVYFIDRLLPEAKALLKADSLKAKPRLVELVHDHITALMGGAGTRSRVQTYNLALRFTKDPIKAMQMSGDLDLAVNVFNNFMVAKGMGFKASSIIANALNTFMTGWAEVGTRAYLHGVKSAFTQDGWRLAQATGTVRFIPYIHAEIADGLFTAMKGGHVTLRAIEAGSGKVAQVSMAPFTFIEKFNHVLMTNAGAWKGRNVLGMHPVEAARYGSAVSRGTNWLYGVVDKPLALTGPIGRAGGLFQTWRINYMEKMVDYGRQAVEKGDYGPLVRSAVALMLTAGTAAIPMYREVKQQIIKRTGKDVLPEINPIEWLTWAAGLGSGWTIEGALSPFNLPQTPGGVTDLIAPLSFAREVTTDPLKAITPSAARGAFEALKEKAAGQALHPRTGKPIARRGAADVAATAFRLRQPAQALRARALSEIANAFQGGNPALARKIVADARRQGLLIDQGTIAAIRRRVEVERRAPSAAAILGRGLD